MLLSYFLEKYKDKIYIYFLLKIKLKFLCIIRSFIICNLFCLIFIYVCIEITDIQHRVNFRSITCWFDVFIYCNMTTIVASTSLMLPASYFCCLLFVLIPAHGVLLPCVPGYLCLCSAQYLKIICENMRPKMMILPSWLVFCLFLPSTRRHYQSRPLKFKFKTWASRVTQVPGLKAWFSSGSLLFWGCLSLKKMSGIRLPIFGKKLGLPFILPPSWSPMPSKPQLW